MAVQGSDRVTFRVDYPDGNPPDFREVEIDDLTELQDTLNAWQASLDAKDSGAIVSLA